jgi:hypothetical protein
MIEQSSASPKADQELEAIGTILRSLDGLDGESIQRVLDYVFNRLSIGRPSSIVGGGVITAASPQLSAMGSAGPLRQSSIKDLRDEKQPDSSNQMAALVAFYLAEVAPSHERKGTVTAADIEKYFKQARFNLPKKIAMTLPNATAAGYFESIGSGTYKLNPVGYNLIAHGLPRDATHPGPKRKRSKKKGERR